MTDFEEYDGGLRVPIIERTDAAQEGFRHAVETSPLSHADQLASHRHLIADLEATVAELTGRLTERTQTVERLGRELEQSEDMVSYLLATIAGGVAQALRGQGGPCDPACPDCRTLGPFGRD